jgi:hypothetical protein
LTRFFGGSRALRASSSIVLELVLVLVLVLVDLWALWNLDLRMRPGGALLATRECPQAAPPQKIEDEDEFEEDD